ncbi:hypothetical protein JCM16303_004158 [Sporobolomyces ruberrimus]
MNGCLGTAVVGAKEFWEKCQREDMDLFGENQEGHLSILQLRNGKPFVKGSTHWDTSFRVPQYLKSNLNAALSSPGPSSLTPLLKQTNLAAAIEPPRCLAYLDNVPPGFSGVLKNIAIVGGRFPKDNTRSGKVALELGINHVKSDILVGRNDEIGVEARGSSSFVDPLKQAAQGPIGGSKGGFMKQVKNKTADPIACSSVVQNHAAVLCHNKTEIHNQAKGKVEAPSGLAAQVWQQAKDTILKLKSKTSTQKTTESAAVDNAQVFVKTTISLVIVVAPFCSAMKTLVQVAAARVTDGVSPLGEVTGLSLWKAIQDQTFPLGGGTYRYRFQQDKSFVVKFKFPNWEYSINEGDLRIIKNTSSSSRGNVLKAFPFQPATTDQLLKLGEGVQSYCKEKNLLEELAELGEGSWHCPLHIQPQSMPSSQW